MSTLLAKMAEPGFWDDRAESQTVLERYRRLDVAIQLGERLSAPLVGLEQLLRQPSGATLARFKDAMQGKLEPLPQAFRSLSQFDAT